MTRDPLAWGYYRLSHDEEDQPTTIYTQKQSIESYFVRELGGSIPADVCWGGWFGDEDVSGTIPLWNRQAGSKLKKRLQSGDHVIVLRNDRLTRADDGPAIMQYLADGNVSYHISEQGRLDLHNPSVQFMNSFQFAQAKFESKMTSKRTKDGLRISRYTHKKPPVPHSILGWRKLRKKEIKNKYRWRWVPCEKTRTLGELIDKLSKSGQSMSKIALWMNQHDFPRLRVTKQTGAWDRMSVAKLHDAFKAGWPIKECYLTGIYTDPPPAIEDTKPKKRLTDEGDV